jgi:hypothetical protein
MIQATTYVACVLARAAMCIGIFQLSCALVASKLFYKATT